jgi:hypothetical protein
MDMEYGGLEDSHRARPISHPPPTLMDVDRVYLATWIDDRSFKWLALFAPP